MHWQRYAIYYTLPPGALAEFAAGWLGWDSAAGARASFAGPGGLPLSQSSITEEPRKYGFHGTLKPPFRLAAGATAQGLAAAVRDLAGRLGPVTLDGLRLSGIGRFLALLPEGDVATLGALAGRVVEELDAFRAPLTAAELARRRKAGLTPVQEAHLVRWGYPYVMEQFRFHLTLTGPLAEEHRAKVLAALRPAVEPLLPRPFPVEAISLLGSDGSGHFHLIQRYALTG